MKRLARWSGHPGAAIWNATVAPRRGIAQAQSIEEALIGQPLSHQLRWSRPEEDLHWECAA